MAASSRADCAPWAFGTSLPHQAEWLCRTADRIDPRECVDHIIVLGEMHLLRVLKSYADYYNSFRTHRSLKKDAPVSRRVQRIGVINLRSIPHASSRVLSFTLDRVEFAPRILRPIQRETIANEPLCKVSPATEHEATVRPYWSREIGSSSLAVSLRSRRDHWPPSRRTDTASYHLPGKADCFPERRCPIGVCVTREFPTCLRQ